MQKPNALRFIQITATFFCVTKLALDIFFIMNSHLSLHTLIFGSDLSTNVLPTEIKFILITEAIVISAPIGILSVLNYIRSDMKYNRGILTLLSASILYIINISASIIINRISFSLINNHFNANIANLTASVNSIRSLTSFLITAAFIMIFCCAAIEVYAGKKAEENKNIKPVYRG